MLAVQSCNFSVVGKGTNLPVEWKLSKVFGTDTLNIVSNILDSWLGFINPLPEDELSWSFESSLIQRIRIISFNISLSISSIPAECLSPKYNWKTSTLWVIGRSNKCYRGWTPKTIGNLTCLEPVSYLSAFTSVIIDLQRHWYRAVANIWINVSRTKNKVMYNSFRPCHGLYSRAR